MVCPKCKRELRKTRGRHQYRECGLDNVFLVEWPVYVCGDCGLKLPELPSAEEVVRLITPVLLRHPERLDGDAVVFLRKAMGMKAFELAQVLGVDRVTVSRWENDVTQIEGLLDLKLRLAAVERILASSARREAIAELVAVFQHRYAPEMSVSDREIEVPPPAECPAAAIA